MFSRQALFLPLTHDPVSYSGRVQPKSPRLIKMGGISLPTWYVLVLITSTKSPKAGIQGPGDLWYFPPGVPHSLQATGDGEGSEFLLVSFWVFHFPNFYLTDRIRSSLMDNLARMIHSWYVYFFGICFDTGNS